MKTLKNHVTALILIFPIFSCSTLAKDVIWQESNNEFVKLVDQDTTDYGKNDHPATLETDEIKASLNLLKIRDILID